MGARGVNRPPPSRPSPYDFALRVEKEESDTCS